MIRKSGPRFPSRHTGTRLSGDQLQTITVKGGSGGYRALNRLGHFDSQRRWRGTFTRFHAEVVGHQMPWTIGPLAVRHGRIAAFFDLGDEFVLDAEHHIGIEIFVALDEDMG